MIIKKIFYIVFVLIFSLTTNVSYASSLTFSLSDSEKTITEKDFAKKYLLIAIGYTGCPDICPTTMIDMSEAMKNLEKLGKGDYIQPIFITIDPTNDTSANLKLYAQYFNSKIIGLRGEFPELNSVIKQLNATYGYKYKGEEVTPPKLPQGYTVYHSTYIYLYDLNRELVDIFNYNMRGEDMAKAIIKVIDENIK